MKEQTMKKLRQLAVELVKMYGQDADNQYFSAPTLRELANKLGFALSYVTIKNYRKNIETMIKQEVRSISNKSVVNQTMSQINKFPKLPVKKEKVIEKIMVHYTDGTQEEYVLAVKPTIQQPQPAPVIWMGLFNYASDKECIIQKGGFKGCNLKDRTSIKKFFQNYYKLKTWCENKLNEADPNHPNYQPFIMNADTPKDIATLNRIIAACNAEINKQEFFN